jgi:chromate transporter
VTDTGERRPGRRDLVPLGEAARAWFAISLQTFGGPAGQIAVMQRELVDERRWIGQQRFLHALNYCMLLPGPEAQQLATYIGWLLNGTAGGLIAGTLFVLPGVLAMLLLSTIYVAYGTTAVVTGVFFGVAPAVLAIVVQALLRIGRRAVDNPAWVALSVGAFIALFVFTVPFPVVVAAAAVAGWLLGRVRPALVHPTEQATSGDEPAPVVADDALHEEPPGAARALRVLVLGVLTWGVPLALVAIATGWGSTLTTEGLYVSGTALVTFGAANPDHT